MKLSMSKTRILPGQLYQWHGGQKVPDNLFLVLTLRKMELNEQSIRYAHGHNDEKWWCLRPDEGGNAVVDDWHASWLRTSCWLLDKPDD
mgnify:CR=1 FL=1